LPITNTLYKSFFKLLILVFIAVKIKLCYVVICSYDYEKMP